MTQKITLNALLRAEKDPKDSGIIPAVVYGGGKENQNLKIKKNDFDKIYSQAGESSLLDLVVNGNSEKVIIKDVQRSFLKNSITHIDFYRVNMNKKIEVETPLEFVNESDAVKNLGGILVKNVEVVKIESLPGDLIDSIKVDLSLLKDFSDSIRVKDLKISSSVDIVDDEEMLIATAIRPKIKNEKQENEEGGDKEKAEEAKEGEEKKTEGDSK